MTAIPSQLWRSLAVGGAPRRKRWDARGIDAAALGVAGAVHRATHGTASYLTAADLVLALEGRYATLGESDLTAEVVRLREIYRRGRETNEDRTIALGVIREVTRRETGMLAFPVQVAGALAISDGFIAEMATGEGKTLTAIMPSTLAGWRGRGCHVVTANDYLAVRDAKLNARVLARLGLRVAHVEGGMDRSARRGAYQADITYCTNKEIAADYLRDRLALGKITDLPSALIESLCVGSSGKRLADAVVMRGLEHAIIDEADFVLIDESATPLIISETSPDAPSPDVFLAAAQMARVLSVGEDFRVDFAYREVVLTPRGRRRLRSLAVGIGQGKGGWESERRAEELVVNALTAEHLYLRGQQYVIEKGKAVIVDESTGRLMPDRSWRDGVHQAVEAKEGLPIREIKETRARISFQRFFRMYRHIGGMSGTVAESAPELWSIYRVPVVRIPTNRPCIRELLPEQTYATAQEKWAAIVEEARAMRDARRAVLIGTRTVGESEQISQLLRSAGIEHQVLNAVRHREEAAVVARAGEAGRVTVATNMAGRGTDIMLDQEAREAGGLHVIATTRHDSPRIDRQLIGRAGRQGDPGSARFFTSLQDEIVRRYASGAVGLLVRRLGSRTGDVAGRATRFMFTRAQARASEAGRSQRRNVLRTDEWLDDWLGFAGRE